MLRPPTVARTETVPAQSVPSPHVRLTPTAEAPPAFAFGLPDAPGLSTVTVGPIVNSPSFGATPTVAESQSSEESGSGTSDDAQAVFVKPVSTAGPVRS